MRQHDTPSILVNYQSTFVLLVKDILSNQQDSKPKFVKLGTVVAMVAFFSLAILAIVFTALENIEDEVQLKVKESLRTVLRATQEAHHIWIQHRLLELRNAAQSERITLSAEIFSNPKSPSMLLASAEANVERSFALMMETYQDDAYWLSDVEGRILNSNMHNQVNTLHPLFEYEHLKMNRVLEGEAIFITGINQAKAKQLNNMYFSAPVIDQQQQIKGVLIISVNQADHFSRITQLGRIWDSGETYAFDRNGLMLSSSRFDEELHRSGILEPGQSAINNLYITDPKAQANGTDSSFKALTFMAQSATQGNTSYNTEGYPDYRGVTVVGAWTWQPTYDFGLTTEIDKAEAFEVYGRTRNIVVLGIVSSVSVAISLFFLLYFSQRNAKLNLRQAQLVLEDRVRERTSDLEASQQELRTAYRELEKQSITDSLTGIPNRRCADEFLEQEWRRAQRGGYPITIMLIDIDHFKQFNDHYGHPAGDVCLEQVAKALIDTGICKRPGDLIARYGGEEFIAILSNSDYDYAEYAANRLIKSINQQQIPHKFTRVESLSHVTISVGVSIAESADIGLEEIISLSDQALYNSKQNGRNSYSFKLPIAAKQQANTQQTTKSG
ncbi:diguanylate cyclase [Agarivorans sp. 1_MG-2023]|uniref:sensor domain-containing diguanylate cyclase n=1 Tax=Agarivorans sp. 1_MG-2023 TaxID=3062634 RepID=UPI0026E12945|nr:diguanylate cyclase [Agarivorans sp. 1_MG-2023]MDO6765492.1 diguanylate cyclase [Agarivorans sp. 1_MG-2023]